MDSRGRISAIGPQERMSGRVAIHIDGVKELTVHPKALESLGIEEGATVDIKELLESAAAAERRAGMAAALTLLGVRDRSAAELQERLRRKGFAHEVAVAVVERLQELGYVDDRRYAGELVRGRMAQRPEGKRALQRELWRRGIEGKMIDEALEECFGGVDEVALAVEVIERRLPRLANVDVGTARRRLVALLQRRGFDFEVIQEAVTRAMPETDMDEDVASSTE